MKILEMPGFGSRGHIIQGMDPNISYKDWMELGKIHLNDLVTVFDTSPHTLSKKRYGNLIRQWALQTDCQTYELLKSYGIDTDKKYEQVLINWETEKERFTEEDRYWIEFQGFQVVDFDSLAVRVTSIRGEDDKPTGIFASGELDWHSNEGGRLNFASGVGLKGHSNMQNSATGFMQTADWYEDQNKATKDMLNDIIVEHCFHRGKINPSATEEDQKDTDLYTRRNQIPVSSKLPLVRTSAGGIKGLSVCNNTIDKIVGMTDNESEEFWKWLKSELYQDKYIYDHWYQSDNEFVVFDQAITQHRRLGHTQDETGRWSMGKRVALRMQMDYKPLLDYHNMGYYNPWLKEPWASDYEKYDTEMKSFFE